MDPHAPNPYAARPPSATSPTTPDAPDADGRASRVMVGAVAGLVALAVGGVGGFVLAPQVARGTPEPAAGATEVVDPTVPTPTGVHRTLEEDLTPHDPDAPPDPAQLAADARIQEWDWDEWDEWVALDPDVALDYLEGGGLDDPWTLPTGVYTDAWDLDISLPREAGAVIRDADPENVPPDGMEYWVIPLEITSTWASRGSAAQSITFSFLADDGVSYSQPCGTIPLGIDDVGEVALDETVRAYDCLTVPAGANGVWRLSVDLHTPVHLVPAS